MGTANLDSKQKDVYEVWVGDTLVLVTEDKERAYDLYAKTPSGKGKAPSKRRTLKKCKILKSDD